MKFSRLLTAVLCLCSSSLAQSDRGTITGTISDSSGAVVANASIQGKNLDTGSIFEAASSTTGNYTLSELPAGMYEVSVSVPGFKRYVRSGLTVEVARTLRIDITLELGAATESILVTGAASLLKTESGDLGYNVATENLDTLPILGIGISQAGSTGIRNPDAALEMIPGTFYNGNNQVRVNGAPNNTQGFQIEGMEATNSNNPNITGGTAPNVDSIQEMAVQTSNYAAEYGQVGGGLFNVTMKSGTNQLHGSGLEYFGNEALNAGEPFYTGEPNPRPRSRPNDFGFTAGGPVYIPKVYNGRDKTFFFVSWEDFRIKQTYTAYQTIPAPAYRTGDFAAAILPNAIKIGTDPLGNQMLQGMIYDPQTAQVVNGQVVLTQFPNNTIPANRFDPVAVKIQNLYPTPSGPTANGLVNNFLPVFPTGRTTSIPSVKGDELIGPKAKLSLFWMHLSTAAVPPGPPNGTDDGLPDPLVTATATFITTQIARVNYDYTLSPTMLLHLGVGYQHVEQNLPTVTKEGNIPNYNAAGELGLQGAIVNKFFPPMSGLLASNGTGGSVNIGGAADAITFTEHPSSVASLTWVKNNHTYKFGAQFDIYGYPVQNYSNTSGSYVFSQAQTGQPFQINNVAGANVGFPYASFLLGAVQQVSISNPVFPRIGKTQFGSYIQDTWKIRRNITLDYGLRYDYSTYLKDGLGRDPSFSEAMVNPLAGLPGGTIYDGYGPGRCNCNVAHNYPFGLGPRLGLAYQITSKTVFRAGFGIVYDGTETNNQASSGLAGSSSTQTAASFGAAVTALAVGIPRSLDPAPWPNYNARQYPSSFPIPGPGAPLFDQNAGRPPRQYQWSIGFQREIMRDLAVEAAYVGSRGIWWVAPGLINLNAIPQQMLAAHGLNLSNPTDDTLLTSTLNSPIAAAMGFSNPPYNGFPLGQTVAQSLRPYPQYTTIAAYWDPLGDTWYNALQAKATKRFSHGLSFLGTFAWSKSLDSGAENDPSAGTAGLAVFNDVFNRSLNKYLSLYDQPFQFRISLNYTTPNVRANKVLSYILRNWTYGALLSYQSGLPLEVPLSQNTLNTSSLVFESTFADRMPGQPLFLKNLNCHCFDRQTTQVLNPAAWTDPPNGQFGTSAAYYSDYRTERRPIENMNFGRTWRMKERASLNVRIEFTNIFNRSVVGDPSGSNFLAPITRLPNGNISSGFGYINATSAPTTTGSANVINLSPRTGILVARFTF